MPGKIIPSKIHSQVLVVFLNRLLAEQLSEGDLGFLEHKYLCINISDAGIKYYLSLKNQKLISVASQNIVDIEIQANLYHFLQLAARQQDSDTLVFQRLLIMQGSTELGLELKNFLDGLDLESSTEFTKIERLLKKILPLYKRIFS